MKVEKNFKYRERQTVGKKWEHFHSPFIQELENVYRNLHVFLCKITAIYEKAEKGSELQGFYCYIEYVYKEANLFL